MNNDLLTILFIHRVVNGAESSTSAESYTRSVDSVKEAWPQCS